MIETPHKGQEWAAATARECKVSATYMERYCGLALKLHRADVAGPWQLGSEHPGFSLTNLVETNGRIVGVDLRW